MKLSFNNAMIDRDVLLQARAKTDSLREMLERASVQEAYTDWHSFVRAPFDHRTLGTYEEMRNAISSPSLRFVFVVGAGGSILGTRAVYDAQFGVFDLATVRIPKLIWLDTIHPRTLADAAMFLDAAGSVDECVFVIVSKSGNTTETVGNSEILLQEARKRFGDAVYGRTVVVVEEDTPLFEEAGAKTMYRIGHQKMIGGRYSVGSSSSIVPLSLLGIDISAFLKGAKDSISKSVTSDEALLYGIFLAHHFQKGRPIHDLFFFDPYLETLGKWGRQLIAESLGKTISTGISQSRIGITPTVSLGSADLHSVAQLTFGGPLDKTALIVSVEDDGTNDSFIPTERTFPFVLSNLSGKSARSVYQAIYQGTLHTYREQGIPFVECTLETRSLEEIGAYMYWQMVGVVFAGHLLGVDPFNQPDVEMYKTETRRILSEM